MARKRKQSAKKTATHGRREAAAQVSSQGPARPASKEAQVEKAQMPRRATSPSPRKLPTQQRARETVGAILQAAAEVFVQLGYADATTNKIAARAGVSIGTLYQYFPNKESIVAMLFEHQIRASLPRIDAAIRNLARPKAPLRDGLRLLVDEVIALHEMSPRLHRVLFDELPRTESTMAIHAQAEAHHIELTASVLAQIPAVRSENRETIAALLVQTTEALVHWLVLRAPPTLERDTCIDEIVELLYRYTAGP
jgi:AcrR family transcriptional regulator